MPVATRGAADRTRRMKRRFPPGDAPGNERTAAVSGTVDETQPETEAVRQTCTASCTGYPDSGVIYFAYPLCLRDRKRTEHNSSFRTLTQGSRGTVISKIIKAFTADIYDRLWFNALARCRHI